MKRLMDFLLGWAEDSVQIFAAMMLIGILIGLFCGIVGAFI